MKKPQETVAEVIAGAQKWAGVSDEEFATIVGYDLKAVRMIKTGKMRLPVNKVAAFAKAVVMDPRTLLEAVLTEYSPEIWTAISGMVLGDLSETEKNLIRHLRSLTGNRKSAPVVLDGSAVIAIVVSQ